MANRVKKPFKKANRLSDKVKDTLKKASRQGKIDITIADVLVGGSVAHGTAVPGHFDIDLVVFSPSLLPRRIRISEEKYKAILHQIMECLEQSLKKELAPHNKQRLYHGWRFSTRYFTVDLQLSPQWEKPDLEDMYDYLQDLQPPSRRSLFACGAAKYHNELLGSQPHRVKVLIKRIKAWRNEHWDSPENGCPKSYFLSLLVLISYTHAPPSAVGAKRLRTLAVWMTQDIKKRVKSISEDKNLDLRIPGENPIIKRKYERYLPDKPRIVDPANPFKNLYVQGLCQIDPQQNDSPAKRWEIFVDKISSLNLVMNLT